MSAAYFFYGDDFTGATDTLATLARAGNRALLFTRIPDARQLQTAGPLDAIGIAGAARSMAPHEMRDELEAVGKFFESTGAPVLHYKTCSTFDSAPHIGSIGVALGTLRRHARNPLVAIVGGQPQLGRYCLFGHLFAAAQTGGEVVRLDRHPTMRQHPVTPMNEADLRLHLAAQGLGRTALMAYPAYDESPATQRDRLDALLATQPSAVLFDVARSTDLECVGRLLSAQAQRAPLLVVGPSSVAEALTRADAAVGNLPALEPASGPVFVLAGSLSPMTARQVAGALSYMPVLLDVDRLARADAAWMQARVDQIADALREGRHVIAYTGPKDISRPEVPGAALAMGCGRLLDAVLRACPVRRVGIAGGDTSSHALKALDVWGLRYAGALAPGVALCRASSDAPHLDGIEMMLKGGQMGSPDLFERLITPR